MTTDLTPFSNGEFELEIRVDGDTFIVLAPGLARALGFASAKDMLRSIPDTEKGWGITPTLGGEQRVGHVTEAGFYRALGRRQPARITDPAVRASVERFQTWVFADVLPSIRRHGVYATPEMTEEWLTDPDRLIEALTALKAERQARQAVEAENAKLAPKADAFDRWLDGTGCYSVGTVARMLGVGQTTMFRFLYDQKVLIGHGRRKRQPYANRKFDGWFNTCAYDQADTNGHASTWTGVTPKGAEGIRLLAIEKGLIEPALFALPPVPTSKEAAA